MILAINPFSYVFLFLFAPIALLIFIGIFGLIRLTIKEYSKKDKKENADDAG